MQRRCLGCMELYEDTYGVCPCCGRTTDAVRVKQGHLQPGTVLANRYTSGRVLRESERRVEYLSFDQLLEDKVVLTEFYPKNLSVREEGKDEIRSIAGKEEVFSEESVSLKEGIELLASWQGVSGILEVYESFEENGTVYAVSEYAQGRTLREYLKKYPRPDEETLKDLASPLIETLMALHEHGLLHKRLSFDRIVVTDKGEVKLRDIGELEDRIWGDEEWADMTDYFPKELYTEEQEGTWTDVYMLGAVLYRAVTGENICAYPKRKAGAVLKNAYKKNKNTGEKVNQAFFNALALNPSSRTPGMEELKMELIEGKVLFI